MLKPIGDPDADKYIARLCDAKKSPGTIELYSYILRGLVRFLGKDLKSITFEDLLMYSNHLTGRVSQNVQITHLTVILNFIDNMGYLPRDVIKRIQIPKTVKKIPKYLNEYESAKLLSAAQYHPRDYAVISTFLYCGLRLSELLALNVSDINFREGFITINRGKGAKGRVIPLPDQVRTAIMKYLEYRIEHGIIPMREGESDALFLGQGRRQIKRDTIMKMLSRYSVKAGLPHVHAHMLRHSCLTALYKKSKDILFVSRMAGHANVGITSHYAHISVQELKDTYQKAQMVYSSEIPNHEPEYPKKEPNNRLQGYQ